MQTSKVLVEYGIYPSERKSQNFITDPAVESLVTERTLLGADVVEVGAGPGNLTEGIAKRAYRVTTLDVDPNMISIQQDALGNTPNVRIVQKDAVKFDWKKWTGQDRDVPHQVIGNIPFHISEALITNLAQLPPHAVDDITLVVGSEMARELTLTNPMNEQYGRMSFIARTFSVQKQAEIPSTAYWPVSKTETALISLGPKEVDDSQSSTALGLRKAIVASMSQKAPLSQVISNYNSQEFVGEGKKLDKHHSHKHDRRKVRMELNGLTRSYNGGTVTVEKTYRHDPLIKKLDLPASILGKPFNRLDNHEIRKLEEALQKI